MPRPRIFSKTQLTSEQINTANWKTVNLESLTLQDREKYLIRKAIIEEYFHGSESVKIIAEKHGLSRVSINRLVSRCLEQHPDGDIYGFRSLLPWSRVYDYSRKDTLNKLQPQGQRGGMAGAFNKLIETYPELSDYIVKEWLGIGKHKDQELSLDNIISPKVMHKKFLAKCKQLKIGLDSYPFNVEYLGYNSLRKYCKKIETIYYSKAAGSRYGRNAGRIARMMPQPPEAPIVRPYHRVQFDGHRMDILLSIDFSLPNGDMITQLLKRFWILTILDVGTRSILGYYISFNDEYTSEDVLQCIKKAIVPWKKRVLSIPGLNYNDEAGMPSEIPECCWGLWDEFSYDNAKSNLAKIVTEKLEDVVGCSIQRGPVATPETRAIIERFFKHLEETCIHRLPSTTGSSPEDLVRKSPEKKAKQYKISPEELEDLIDIVIANYNAEPHSGNYCLSPLDAIKQRLTNIPNRAARFEIRQLPPNERDNLRFFTMLDKRKVIGSIETGKRPHINYLGAVYTSGLLADSPQLIGKKLALEIDIEDLRKIKAFLPSGAEFGELFARGGWGLTKHSLKTRKAIMKLTKEKRLHYIYNQDPVIAFQDYLREKAKNNRSAANNLLTLLRGSDNGYSCNKDNHTPPKCESPENQAKEIPEDHIPSRKNVESKKRLISNVIIY